MNTSCQNVDFVGNSIAESNAYLFVNTLKFIFTHFIEIRIFEKQFLALKKILFSKADFQSVTY